MASNRSDFGFKDLWSVQTHFFFIDRWPDRITSGMLCDPFLDRGRVDKSREQNSWHLTADDEWFELTLLDR